MQELFIVTKGKLKVEPFLNALTTQSSRKNYNGTTSEQLFDQKKNNGKPFQVFISEVLLQERTIERASEFKKKDKNFSVIENRIRRTPISKKKYLTKNQLVI